MALTHRMELIAAGMTRENVIKRVKQGVRQLIGMAASVKAMPEGPARQAAVTSMLDDLIEQKPFNDRM